MRRFLLLLALPILSSIPVHAADYYVDATAGDDANTGSSPGDAWRRVTHALAVMPPPPPGERHVLHLAPGTYSAAAGEVFPLPIRDDVVVVGDGGSAVTLLDGGGFRAMDPPHSVTFEARGVTLANGQNGVHVYWYTLDETYDSRVTLEDVHIRDMSQRGLDLDAYGGYDNDADCEVVLRDVRIERCASDGAWITCGSLETSQCLVTATDLELVDCGGWGLRTGVYGEPGGGHATITRGRLTGNALGGLTGGGGPPYSAMSVLLHDTLVAQNTGPGVGVHDAFVRLVRSTVAHNLDAGLRLDSSCYSATLESSILYGNLDDLDDGFGGTEVAWCDIGDGDHAGGSGNLAVDPGFRDPATGDYRLGHWSRCVDRGAPDDTGGAPDLAGVPRPIDGDLDTDERVDMGAFELAPLALAGAPRVGATVQLECWGRPGGSARVFFAPGPPVDPPLPTPFGELDLERAITVPFASGSTAPGPPALLDVPIPDDATLVGATWSFQSLSTGRSLAPGRALTNVVSFVIGP